MSPFKLLAFLLIGGGALGLVFGSFVSMNVTRDVDLGVVALSGNDRDSAIVSMWAGVAGVAAGAALLAVRRGV